MRLAKLNDFRRRLKERGDDWVLKLERFAFEDMPGTGTGEIPLGSPIAVLAGPNGVAKTTILKSIWAAAAPEIAKLGPSTALKLSGGTARLDYRIEGAAISSTVSFSRGKVQGADNSRIEVLHLDTAVETRRQQEEFCAFSDVDDLINGVGSRTLDPEALADINYLSKRAYREIKIYEAETDLSVSPFFEVSFDMIAGLWAQANSLFCTCGGRLNERPGTH
jgi:hypothetical protein